MSDFLYFCHTISAVIAQLVEHRLPKPRVTGSSPAYRSRDVVQGFVALRYFFVWREPVTLIAPFRGWGCKSKVTPTRACTSFESRLPLGDVVQGMFALRYFF